jgi:hypothetical protein
VTRRLAALVAVAILGAAAAVALLLFRASDGAVGYAFAVTGDLPYTQEQLASFPAVIAQLNADPAVRLVVHLGDIKAAGTLCTDDWLRTIRAAFDDVQDPLLYTPGDNEWTDCHRGDAGGYDPLERLAAVRRVFFDEAWRSLGQRRLEVTSQAPLGLPENVRWQEADISFATLHLVGANNGMATWTGENGPAPRQMAEVIGRTAGAIENIREAFSDARADDNRAVVLFMQADMFAPRAAFSDSYAFQSVVAAIAQEVDDFGGPVYLFNGDTHEFAEDRPLEPGSPWLDFYGVPAAPDLRRVTIDGSTNATNYLLVTVSGEDEVLTWTRVPFGSSGERK